MAATLKLERSGPGTPHTVRPRTQFRQLPFTTWPLEPRLEPENRISFPAIATSQLQGYKRNYQATDTDLQRTTCLRKFRPVTQGNEAKLLHASSWTKCSQSERSPVSHEFNGPAGKTDASRHWWITSTPAKSRTEQFFQVRFQ